MSKLAKVAIIINLSLASVNVVNGTPYVAILNATVAGRIWALE